jgi:hypothetical protein
MNPKKLLDSVHRKPGLFWGDSEHPFTSLIAFISGVTVGGGPVLAPADFHQFVAEHFSESSPSAKGWMTFIRDHTTSEQEAFELFFRLLAEYEHTTA